jgi:hypothetical protein
MEISSKLFPSIFINTLFNFSLCLLKSFKKHHSLVDKLSPKPVVAHFYHIYLVNKKSVQIRCTKYRTPRGSLSKTVSVVPSYKIILRVLFSSINAHSCATNGPGQFPFYFGSVQTLPECDSVVRGKILSRPEPSSSILWCSPNTIGTASTAT